MHTLSPCKALVNGESFKNKYQCCAKFCDPPNCMNRVGVIQTYPILTIHSIQHQIWHYIWM